MDENSKYLVTEILADLSMAMEYGTDQDYHRTEDNRIAVRRYEDDGTLTDVIGHLSFEAVK